MSSTRWYSAAILAGILVLAGSPARADDEPAPAEPPQAPPAPASDAGSGKPSWWGGRNLLFLQIGYGQSSFDTIETSVTTEGGNFSGNEYDIDDTTAGRVAVGWTLPDERGQFLVSFEGIKEDGFEFSAVGMQSSAIGTTSASAPLNPIPWWTVSVRDGVLQTAQTPPVWDGTRTGPDCGVGCDRNSDGRADFDEVDYPTIQNQATTAAPKTLNNDLKTLDFLYGREWGGRRIWGNWSAGGRYFAYDGAVPMGAWLAIAAGTPGTGYTDGVENRLLTLRQDTSGFGPTGSLGINFGFFRRKLVLSASGRVSYLLTSLESNTGDFVTLIHDPGGPFLTAPANLKHSLDKSVWHLQALFAVRWEVAPGLNLVVDYRRSGFQDAILLPIALSIPDNLGQAAQGTVAVYATRDFRVQTVMAGVSYQF